MKKHKYKILVAAGGTAGHIFPAQNIIKTLGDEYDIKSCLVTDNRGEKIIQKQKNDFQTFTISAATITLKKPAKIIKQIFSIIYGICQSIKIIYFNKITLFVGFGGYPSLPPAIAAIIARIPIIIHEQNCVMGKANRFIAPFADIILLANEKCLKIPEKAKKNTIVTGNPIRKEFFQFQNNSISDDVNHVRKILIFGGSQGAILFTTKIPPLIANINEILKNKITILQQVQKKYIEKTQKIYHNNNIKADIRDFIDNMPDEMANADLVIARAGAGTIAEIIALKKPAILIPLETSIEGEQLQNAIYLKNNKCAVILEEKNIYKIKNILQMIIRKPKCLIKTANAYTKIQKNDASKTICRQIYRIFYQSKGNL